MTRVEKNAIRMLKIFFVPSGLTGLVYEIIWTRQLCGIFGNTVFAVSAILSAFMGGLSLGSYLSGKFVDKIEKGKPRTLERFLRGNSLSPHLKLYGILELIIGLYALLTPVLVNLVRRAYVSFIHSFSLPLYPLSLATFVISVLIFLVPTVCMGATLPTVLKFIIKARKQLMSSTARFYSLNTFGAVLGSFLAGFILLPTIGVSSSLSLAAVINILIGVNTILITYIYRKNKNEKTSQQLEAENQTEPRPADNPSTPKNKNDKKLNRAMNLILIVYFISGFTAMVYEVCWTRTLALSMGSTVYSFSTILTTFLLGIALGSYLFSNTKLFRQEKMGIMDLANLELGIGALCFLIIPLLGCLPYVFLRMFPYLKQSYIAIIGGNFLISSLVIMVPTILFGISFPLVTAIYTRDFSKIGRSIGQVYATNTAGNIVGSFAAGFIFIPLIGVENSIKLAVFFNVLASSLIYFHMLGKLKNRVKTYLKIALIILIIIGIFSFSFWKYSAMTFGIAYSAENLSGVNSWKEFRQLLQRQKESILYYRDSLISTVSVHQYGKIRVLKMNGKVEASYRPGKHPSPAFQNQWLLGFIPTALHPDPGRVCFIGFGAGISCSAVDQFQEVKIQECVEIEPALEETAAYFRQANDNILDSPRFRLYFADGRNFMLASTDKYDLIISGLSNPWIAGVTNLYTVEFYTEAIKKLKDDGIFCQWIHTYRLDVKTLRSAVKSFYSVFPHGSVWLTMPGNLLMIGRKNKRPVDYRRIERAFNASPLMKKNLKKIGYIHPYQLIANRIMDADGARAFSLGTQANTDNLPVLEFQAPLTIYQGDNRLKIIKSIIPYQDDSYNWLVNLNVSGNKSPEFFYNLAVTSNSLLLRQRAVDYAQKSIEVDESFYAGYLLLAHLYRSGSQNLKAENALIKAIEVNPRRHEAFVELIKLYQSNESPKLTLKTAEVAYKFNPQSAEILHHLLRLQIETNQVEKAVSGIEKLLKVSPNTRNKLLAAKIYKEAGRYDNAKQILDDVLKTDRQNREALKMLAEIHFEKNDLAESARIYRKVLSEKLEDVPTAIALGKVLEKMGRIDEAKILYKNIIKKDPENPGARENLYRLQQNR